MSMQELAPAIVTNRSTKRPLTIAQDRIKFGLGLMMTKIRKYHLRDNDMRVQLNGTSLSITMTAERVRDVRAIAEAKEEVAEAKAIAKETATKKK